MQVKSGARADRAELADVDRRAVGFADIFQEGDTAAAKLVQQPARQGIVAQDVSNKDRPSPRSELGDYLLVVHAERTRIDIDEDRLEAAVQHGGNVGNPRDRRYDDLTARPVQLPQSAQGHEVGRR